LLVMTVFASSDASFFVQTPCGSPCSGGCPQQPPCPVPPPPPVCPQYPPCGGAESALPPQSYAGSVVDQFVQQQYPQPTQYQAPYPSPQPDYLPRNQYQTQYPTQNQYQQSKQYRQPAQEYAGVNKEPQQQQTVIYLDQQLAAKGGKRPQVVYQSLPSGGSQLIVPPGSNVYALNTGAGSSYQYQQPRVVYHTDQLPAGGYNSGAYAAVEQSVDEMDLKGMEWGIPLKPTEHRRSTLDAIEKLADDAEVEEERVLIRKARALNDDVIAREEQEQKDYGDLISSEEEVEMIGGRKKEKIEKVEMPDEEEEEQEIETTTPTKVTKHHEKSKKSHRSSKRARAESGDGDEAPRDNDDLDRKKCNSRRLYEIMLENMNESSASSKRTINSVAEAEFGTSIDVVCSRGHFSYVFSSNLFCEASKGHVTCIAFRQAPPTPVEE
ncbi:hypothetical protein PENTCL1PPCAC_3615, partial [Pristionchus entomophagus]